MKVVYLAHEGDDLDSEFPAIFKDYWEDTNREIEEQRQAKVNGARKQPFIPGKGGNTGPSKPLTLKGNESSKDIADMLWNQFGGSDT